MVKAVAATCLLTVAVVLAGFSVVEAGATEELSALTSERIAMINDGDRKAFVNAYHPDVRRLMQQNHPEYFDDLVTRALEAKVPDNARREERVLPPEGGLPFENALDYPVRPTRAMVIEYEIGPGFGSTRIWLAVERDRRWFWVVGVPKAEVEKAIAPPEGVATATSLR